MARTVAVDSHTYVGMLAAFDMPISWGELAKRTAKETSEDDALGLAAQLAYYFFLALFPTILCLLAIASFFPVHNLTDEITGALAPVAPPEILSLIREQLVRLSNGENGGIFTIGFIGAIWSSSAAMVAVIGALNRAYDIEEGRPWWKVRLIAIGLTLALAVFLLLSFALILAGPAVGQALAERLGLGVIFRWTWMIVQWPLAFFLVSTALGLVYYMAPDAEQDWTWITPGAFVGTLLWLLMSLAFSFYISNFTDYNATYGAIGGVVVLLLWFYVSGLAIIVGAEANAEIEHASPHGKDPGEKVPGQKKKIGTAAARAYAGRQPQRGDKAGAAAPPPGAESPEPLSDRAAVAVPHAAAIGVVTVERSDTRSLAELFSDLAQELRRLVQSEIRLAKTEMSGKVAAAAKSVGVIAVGGLIAYAGVLALVAALVLALNALGVPAWAAALIGAVLVIGGGYLLIRTGLTALRQVNFAPTETLETLKQTPQAFHSDRR